MIDFKMDISEDIEMKMETSEDIDFNIKEEIHKVYEDDYEKLRNLPSLNGEKIVGNVKERDPTVPNWAKQSSKPSYTANEVGAVDDGNALSLAEIDEIFNGLFDEKE